MPTPKVKPLHVTLNLTTAEEHYGPNLTYGSVSHLVAEVPDESLLLALQADLGTLLRAAIEAGPVRDHLRALLVQAANEEGTSPE